MTPTGTWLLTCPSLNSGNVCLRPSAPFNHALFLDPESAVGRGKIGPWLYGGWQGKVYFPHSLLGLRGHLLSILKCPFPIISLCDSPPPFLLRFFSPLTSPFILVFSLLDIGYIQREFVVPSRVPSLVFLGSRLWLCCLLSFAHEPVQQLSQ